MRIAVVGLGKLGAPLAGMLARTGAMVTGVDRDADLVRRLQRGETSQVEPGLQPLLLSAGERLRYTTDTAEAVRASDATFILVPTPSTASGDYDNADLLGAIAQIGAAIAGKADHHLVVVVSTVMPGTMGNVLAPALAEAAGRPLGDRLGLCYCPEFVALGAVIAGMERPDLLLVGQSDETAGKQLISLLRPMWTREPAIWTLDFINAELAKLAVNGFVTTKISYANMLAELCETLPGADARIVTAVLGSDSRIGPGYLAPGLGFAGPCFPRDNGAIIALASQAGLRADLAEATNAINQRQAGRVVDLVGRMVPHGTIGVLGLAYKPDSDVCEASQGVEIAHALAGKGYRVLVHDPKASIELPAVIERHGDAGDCVRQCGAIIIATPWQDYARIARSALERDGNKLIVIDCWRMAEWQGHRDLVELIYPGMG